MARWVLTNCKTRTHSLSPLKSQLLEHMTVVRETEKLTAMFPLTVRQEAETHSAGVSHRHLHLPLIWTVRPMCGEIRAKVTNRKRRCSRLIRIWLTSMTTKWRQAADSKKVRCWVMQVHHNCKSVMKAKIKWVSINEFSNSKLWKWIALTRLEKKMMKTKVLMHQWLTPAIWKQAANYQVQMHLTMDSIQRQEIEAVTVQIHHQSLSRINKCHIT